MLTGSCLCRSVRYTVTADIADTENCHCSMCRKAHGAAFSTNGLVPTDALAIEGGEYLSRYRSSPNREKLFCSRCGSQLFIKRLNAPEGTVITLGTLDGDPGVKPSRHVFVANKAPWHPLDSALPAYGVYPGFEPEFTPMPRQLISSGSPFEASIAYSRAVVQGDWIFVSGTTGFDYATMSISPRVEEQARQCLENIEQALRQAGSSLADVVRVHYILPRREDFEPCWPVLREYLGSVRPAATMISAELLDPRMRIEIEVTALRK